MTRAPGYAALSVPRSVVAVGPAALFCAIRMVYVTGGDVNGLIRAVVGGTPYPGADDRDVHGVEQLGEPLDELAIVAAELDVKDVDGVGQGVGQELAGGPVGAVLGAAAEMGEHGLSLPASAERAVGGVGQLSRP